MEDIFSASREGNVKFVRQFLDNIENDLNEGYVFFGCIFYMEIIKILALIS